MNEFHCNGCDKELPASMLPWPTKLPPMNRIGDLPSARCKPCTVKSREDEFSKLCPPLYFETEVSRLPVKQYEQVKSWKYSSTGLLLRGDTGTGKTRCAWKLIERLMVCDLWRVDCFDCIGFAHQLARKFRDEESVEDWVAELADRPIVFFDDLGKLKFTERAEVELFGLIERRCANKKPIIATTNDSGDSLAARMTDNRGPAMIRRLREFCQIIDF
jgi:DNA replication protein DnaC